MVWLHFGPPYNETAVILRRSPAQDESVISSKFCYFARAFTGSLTFSTLSNATFCGSPFTFSTLRM